MGGGGGKRGTTTTTWSLVGVLGVCQHTLTEA